MSPSIRKSYAVVVVVMMMVKSASNCRFDQQPTGTAPRRFADARYGRDPCTATLGACLVAYSSMGAKPWDFWTGPCRKWLQAAGPHSFHVDTGIARARM